MELDPIEQMFVADVSRYLAGIEQMVAAGRDFVGQAHDDVAAVAELQTAIDSLSGKRIELDVIVGETFPEAANQIAHLKNNFDALASTERAVTFASLNYEASMGKFGSAATDAADSVNKMKTAMLALAAADATEVESLAAVDNGVAKLEARLKAFDAAMAPIGSRIQKAVKPPDPTPFQQLQAILGNTAITEQDLANVAVVTGEKIFLQGVKAESKAEKMAKLLEQNNMVFDSEGRLSWAMGIAAASMTEAAARSSAAGDGADKAARSFRIWGTGIRLTGAGLHWLVAGSMEILAVLIPAIIAAGAAAMVMAEGFTWAKDRFMATFTAAEATSSMIGKTTGQVLGLGGALQRAQTAADPKVYEIFGSVINDAGTRFKNFWQQGGQVVDMLDRFAAKVTLDLRGAFGAQMEGLISHMAADLVALGEVFGNLGRIITSIASSMPGLAEVLLGILAGFTRLISAVVSFASQLNFMGINVLTVAIGIEELARWGGLLYRQLGSVISVLGRLIYGLRGMAPVLAVAGAETEAFGVEMNRAGKAADGFGKSLKMLFTTPWGWALLGVAALTTLVIMLARSKTSAQELTSSMEKSLSSDTLVQGLSQGILDLGMLHQQLQTTSKTMRVYGMAVRESAGATVVANPDYQAFAATQADIAGKIAGVLSQQVTYKGHTYGLVESIGLASAAGVQMNQMLDKQGNLTAIAKQQIQNLVQGYASLAQTGGTLNADIQAINVSTLQQQTRVSQLNQAWNTFMQNLTGGTSAIAGLNTDLATIGNVTMDATSKIRAFSQGTKGAKLTVDQIALALTSFSGTSAQVWTNYNAAVMQAQQVTTWLRTAAASGVITSSQYVNAIKGVVAELLPYAADSKTAAAELSGLAFQATGTTMNYKQLKAWVGNTDTAQKNLNKTVNNATQGMANLNDIAKNLSTTLSTAVDNAIAQGSVNTQGLMTATQNLSSSLRTTGVDTYQTQEALIGWVKQLWNANVGADNAKSIMLQLAANMHLSQGDAKNLADEVYNLYVQLSKIHDVSATIRINSIYTHVGTAPGGGVVVSPIRYTAKGGRIPGYGGGDSVPAMLEPGEAVVPKHLVAGVSGYLGAHGVPGFAKGGGVGPIPNPHPGGYPHPGKYSALSPMELIIAQWAKEIWREDLHKYGRHGPIGITEINHLFGATKPGRGAIWNNPQYRLLEAGERHDMAKYYTEDVSYWKYVTESKSIMRTENRQLAHLRHLLHMAELKHDTGLVARYKRDITGTETTDARKLRQVNEQIAIVLASIGHLKMAKGGLVPFGHYDRGGYLPEGLSLALNTTGRPEPVGHGGGGPAVMHVHLEIGGREIANAVVPYMVGSVNRYGIRNSGKATGILKPT